MGRKNMAKDIEHVTGSAMDYYEHDKTYKLFLGMAKWGIASCVALLLGMMVGFFMGGGLVGGTIVFILLMIVSYFVL
jgi:hypothetical protein